MTKIHFTWAHIDKAASYITDVIEEENLQIDTIYGIPRGGLILGVILSHKLDVPLILDPLSAQNKRLLVIDDISDTGTTLKNLDLKLWANHLKYRPIYATIHYKPGSKFKPNIYYSLTNDWIQYAFETEKTSKADYKE